MVVLNPPSIGSALPNVAIAVDKALHVKAFDFFADKKRVIIFGLPGAFTPTCSSRHVPGYELYLQQLIDHVPELSGIYCASVNDPWCMDAWLRQMGADKIHAIADYTNELHAGLGLLVDKTALGLGLRSWRYSMILYDGVIEKLMLEDVSKDALDDPYGRSAAERIMDLYNIPKPQNIFMITRPGCHFCAAAYEFLKSKGLRYAHLDVSANAADTYMTLQAISPHAPTTPRVFIDGKLIGGAEELKQYFAERPADLAQIMAVCTGNPPLAV